MADVIQIVQDGNDVDAFSHDSHVILNSNQAAFLTNRSVQNDDNWIQL